MQELTEHREAKVSWTWKHHAVSASTLILGYLLAQLNHATPGPMVIEKERESEVPVGRINEKRAPYEVVKNVENETNRRTEFPAEERAYGTLIAGMAFDAYDGHLTLRAGMNRSQVYAMVGKPYFEDGAGSLHYYSVPSRRNMRLVFRDELLVEIIHHN